MTLFLFANNDGTTLAGSISNVATTLTVFSGAGALFPSPGAGQEFSVTLIAATDPTIREIVYCTARSGDVFTIVRAREGTTGLAWSAGDLVQGLLTAGQMAVLYQDGKSVGGDLSGSLPNPTVTAVQPGVASANLTPSMQIFSPGTFTCTTPANCHLRRFRGWGGGGGAGGIGGAGFSASGGGGGGGYFDSGWLATTPGASVTVNVGAGGAGGNGTPTDGTGGGGTSIPAYGFVAGGGNPGQQGSGFGGTGGSGGSAGGAAFVLSGEGGRAGGPNGGGGGGSAFQSAAPGNAGAGADGPPGVFPGAGGAGTSGTSVPFNGGSGAFGLVVAEFM